MSRTIGEVADSFKSEEGKWCDAFSLLVSQVQEAERLFESGDQVGAMVLCEKISGNAYFLWRGEPGRVSGESKRGERR